MQKEIETKAFWLFFVDQNVSIFQSLEKKHKLNVKQLFYLRWLNKNMSFLEASSASYRDLRLYIDIPTIAPATTKALYWSPQRLNLP